MAGDVVSDIQRAYLVNLAKEGRRFDDRDFDEYRPITLETGMIKQADGSARVTIGQTEVYCGVKCLVGTPWPDTPNQGVMSTSAELRPMASPDFETGPPSPTSIEVARVIDRGIRESKTIDLSKLCIEPGAKVWMAWLDLHVVDYDGNLFDAGSLGFMAALHTAMLPMQKIGMDDPIPLPVNSQTLMTTAVKIGGELLFDPTALEEKVAAPRLSVSFDDDGNLRAGQKGCSGGLTPEEVKSVMKGGRVQAAHLRATLQDHLKEMGANGR